ncbi:hypothetical protein [Acinetobacter lwoffii]|uniref:hypothetical protein n=1 Tax=Acinetobacter lwoffii TaxID=28090 RepID=UPI0032B3FB7D
MDIQRIKELALANGFSLKPQASGNMDLNAYVYDFANAIEQEAKAQAVPEGYVLVKTSDRDQEMLELIDQRDHMEGQAEELKDKLQALYGVNFGEHSSCNFPFQNAIDYDDSDLVLVPREPNEKMIMNGLLVISTEIGKYDIQQEVRMIWEKMIEAQEPAND